MSLKKYAVADLIVSPSQLKVLFVLESPHKDEFIHSHPAAGSTGKKLSALFTKGFLSQFIPTEPIGCQIKKYNYPHLGIIETSNLPMDMDFYPCFLSSADKRLVQDLNYTKTRLEKRIQKRYIPNGIVEKYLVNNFSNRLNSILMQSSHPVIIISFGHIAANFINTANVANLKLPHPTGTSWSNAEITLNSFNLSQSLLP